MSWQLSIGVERVKCTHLDFSYRFFCCTSYFNLSAEHGAKPWRYVLVSHDEVSESKTINSFI